MQFALPFVKTNIPAAPGNVPPTLEQSESQFDEDIDDMLETPGPSQLFPAEAPPLPPSLPQQPAPDLSSQQPPSIHSQQPPLSQQPIGLAQPSNLSKKKPGPKRGITTTDVDTTFMDFLQTKTARLTTPKEKDKKNCSDQIFP